MSRCRAITRPLAGQLRQQSQCVIRPFTTGAARSAEVAATPAAAAPPPVPTDPLDLDPNTVMPEFEAHLAKEGKMPIGSRRRRVAIRTTTDVPFEHLPYQAFQEARKILAADRESKLEAMRKTEKKLDNMEQIDAGAVKGGQYMKDQKIASLRRHVEELKILADVNDPVVKKRYEDGLGMFAIGSSDMQLRQY